MPTKRRWKKVSMQLKTQYLGRDVREKMRELVLEEHESCECRCLVVAAAQCRRPGTEHYHASVSSLTRANLKTISWE